MNRSLLACALAALLAPAAAAQLPVTEGPPPLPEPGAVGEAAALPVSGRPVASLSAFDDAMQDYMAAYSIGAGVLGVMREGRVVYLRGFGTAYDGTTPLAENALFRIASCTKPITAAAVRLLDAGDATWDVDDRAFDLGQIVGGAGILDVTPFGGTGDTRLRNVTIQQLLTHQSGWDRDTAGDLAFGWRQASDEMSVPSPPSPDAMMDWLLGEPLQFTPGTDTEYSNIGFLALGLLAEQESGQALMTYIRQRVLTPAMWVPATELQIGRTFRADQDPREPLYDSPYTGDNIYDNTLPYQQVSSPYGTWTQTGLDGYGSFIASAPTILAFLDRYHTGVFDERIGEPITAANPVTTSMGHNGSLRGTNSYMIQRGDSVNVFIVFNERPGTGHYATDFYSNRLDPLLDAGPSWPSTTSDGFWVNMGGLVVSGVGSYSRPFGSLTSALAYVQDGSKLRLRAGSTSWTGVLDTQLLLDAPLGHAVIGE